MHFSPLGSTLLPEPYTGMMASIIAYLSTQDTLENFKTNSEGKDRKTDAGSMHAYEHIIPDKAQGNDSFQAEKTNLTSIDLVQVLWKKDDGSDGNPHGNGLVKHTQRSGNVPAIK
eukprot:Gb_18992 [translate_table: standard]